MIRVKGLNKDYAVSKRYENVSDYLKEIFKPKKEIIHAIKDVSFEVGDGEVIGFLGPNGAGKSTTIKMLTGIIVPTSGIINIDGITPYKNRKAYVKNIGVVFGQRSQLWWDLPVKDSFLLLKKIYKISDKTYKENLSLFSELLDLANIMNRPVRQLSLGQRMRCEVAASFLHNPKIVYLDEPTIGLDIVSKDSLRKIIKYLNKEKKCTIILTTHDVSDIENLCQRIIIINKGQLVFDWGIEAIRKLNNKKKYMTVDLEDDVKLNIDNVEVLEEQGKRKQLSFDNRIISVQQVLNQIGKFTNVINVDIQGKSIEEIIKDIYTGRTMYK